MKSKGIYLTPLETKVLAWSRLSQQRIIRTGELTKILSINPEQEEKLLMKMYKSGLVVRLMRGLYLLPATIPTAPWSPPAYFLLAILMKELNAEYQITGLAAFHFHRLSTQVPNIMMVYNTKFSGRKTIGRASFDFIKVDKNRIGAFENLEINDFTSKINVRIASLARTIVDAIYDYKRFATLPEAYDWIRDRINDEEFLKELTAATLEFSNIATRRRLGYFLESLKANARLVSKIYKSLENTSAYIPLDPSQASRGKINKKWGVKINGRF